MSHSDQKGFTLIELLIVVVLIGILAAIAIPKFSATKDKAKLASVKTDLRNLMTLQEAYFSNAGIGYTGTFSVSEYTPSSGNTFSLSGTASSFTATASNSSITLSPKSCTVTVGDGTATDGMTICS